MLKQIRRLTYLSSSILLVTGVILATTSGCEETGAPDFVPAPGETVTDIDSNVYHTIRISSQTWLVENLKTTRYRNGDPVTNIPDSELWAKTESDAWCNYDSDAMNADTYGRLYNWNAAMDKRQICPEGWHVPTDEDWWRLMNNVGGSVANTGGRMKETGTKHWKSPNKGATDSFGFKALPGGVCGDTIFFSLLGQQGVWWTATDYDSVNARVWGLRFDQESANPGGWPKRNGASIRCVRD